jgi:tetratricopeptide (TPR) repeat protein
MYASHCFQKSAGKKEPLGCISCHDPHALPSEEKKIGFYRERCLNCHKDKPCSLPEPARREQQDSCIACHMTKTGSNVKHTAITDHRILRRPDVAPVKEPAPTANQIPLIYFNRHLVARNDSEVQRDQAIALVALANETGAKSFSRALAGLALPELDDALSRDDADVQALESKGIALWELNRLEDSLDVFEKVLKLAPDRENALFYVARLMFRLRLADTASSRAEQLVKLNPWRWRYFLLLGQTYGLQGNWGQAQHVGSKALELGPAELAVRQFLVECHLRLGERAQAQKEMDTLLALNAAQADVLRRWFAELSRQVGK